MAQSDQRCQAIGAGARLLLHQLQEIFTVNREAAAAAATEHKAGLAGRRSGDPAEGGTGRTSKENAVLKLETWISGREQSGLEGEPLAHAASAEAEGFSLPDRESDARRGAVLKAAVGWQGPQRLGLKASALKGAADCGCWDRRRCRPARPEQRLGGQD
ncbi:MAG: hypothetical protein ACKO9I_07225 [Sphaerospermopsis kisseleviana]